MVLSGTIISADDVTFMTSFIGLVEKGFGWVREEGKKEEKLLDELLVQPDLGFLKVKAFFWALGVHQQSSIKMHPYFFLESPRAFFWIWLITNLAEVLRLHNI